MNTYFSGIVYSIDTTYFIDNNSSINNNSSIFVYIIDYNIFF